MGGKSVQARRVSPEANAKRRKSLIAYYADPARREEASERIKSQWAEGGKARETTKVKYAERDRQIYALRESGAMIKDIADELGVGYMTVRRVLRRRGDPMPSERPALLERKRRVLALADQGMEAVDIVDTVGYGRSVYQILDEARASGRLPELSPAQVIRKNRNDAIRERLALGESQASIARDLGVSRSFVGKVQRGLTRQ